MKQLYDIVEGILDDQDEVMDKMTNDLIFKEIRDFLCSDFWLFPDPTRKTPYDKVEYTFGEDAQGYYFDTVGRMSYPSSRSSSSRFGYKSVAEYIENGVAMFNRFRKKNCPMFRWRKHEGKIIMVGCHTFESLDGMPEYIDFLFISYARDGIKRIIDCTDHKIEKLQLHNIDNLILNGNSKTKINEIEYYGPNGTPPVTKGFTPKSVKKG